MKKKFGIILMSVAIHVALGCVTGLHAQPPVVGGYQGASSTEPGVVSAARFAIRKEKRKRGVRVSLISIEQAETQVVAGINYRLCLKVKIRNRIRSVTTVVYKNLRRRYALSSWEEKSCGSVSGQ